MKTTIYLIRHAEALGNINKTFQGHTDAPLTEKGRCQLDRLAERFRDVAFDAIYSSPLLRTQETAQAANRFHKLPLRLEPDLIEINGGKLEGVRWDEIPQLYPDAFRNWQDAPHLYEAPGGERMRAVYDRMVAAINRIARENEGKAVVVVSHGGAIRNYMCYANGLPYERLREIGWEENTAVSRIEYDEAFCPRAVYQNDVSHLDNAQCTIAHQDWWQSTIAVN